MIIWAKLLPYIKGAALLIAIVMAAKLYIAHVDRTARAEQKAADAAEVSRVRAEAKAADLEHARATEAAHAQGTKEANDALLPELEAARAGLADYARRLRAQATGGGVGGTDMSGASGGPDLADGSDPLPLLDDLDRCTEAVARLKNVQDWWLKFDPAS
ncbi:hypothetical protein GG804_29105 [Sphingomonas histidinilytica]|uniref:hypothetical protein n=1 Tax=Rhizorhabdus histidinilytica TaxID=439228 RepID=UPI001AD9C29B|nr:hypothetical protein [Rhizorhabdus histidinilytica]MBO9380820.1 hypothetical protein [Rhizorhabdus histidinilytica]